MTRVRVLTGLCISLIALAPHVSETQASPSAVFKVFISADMEGVSTAVTWAQTSPDGRDYAVARDAMTDEVNAAIDAAYDGGATDVVVVDAHGGGTNLRRIDVDRRALLISGLPMPMGMMTGID